MAFKTWSTGDVFTAADVNDYLMEQVIAACTSGTRPSSPNEAQAIGETDTDLLRIYSGSAWVTLSSWSALTSYTPTWAASSVNPSIGNGTLSGAYTERGKLGFVYIGVEIGSTTNAGTGTYTWSLPGSWSLASSTRCYGTVTIRDQSGAVHTIGAVNHNSATTVEVRHNGGNVTSGTSPYTLATGDFIRLLCIVEIS